MDKYTCFTRQYKLTDVFLENQRRTESRPKSEYVKLVCANGYTHVHTILVAAQSPELKEILITEKDPFIILPDFDVNSVRKFCRLFYKGFTKVSSKEIEDVIKLASLLMLEKPKISPTSLEEVNTTSPSEVSYFRVEASTSVIDNNHGMEANSNPPAPPPSGTVHEDENVELAQGQAQPDNNLVGAIITQEAQASESSTAPLTQLSEPDYFFSKAQAWAAEKKKKLTQAKMTVKSSLVSPKEDENCNLAKGRRRLRYEESCLEEFNPDECDGDESTLSDSSGAIEEEGPEERFYSPRLKERNRKLSGQVEQTKLGRETRNRKMVTLSSDSEGVHSNRSNRSRKVRTRRGSDQQQKKSCPEPDQPFIQRTTYPFGSAQQDDSPIEIVCYFCSETFITEIDLKSHLQDSSKSCGCQLNPNFSFESRYCGYCRESFPNISHRGFMHHVHMCSKSKKEWTPIAGACIEAQTEVVENQPNDEPNPGGEVSLEMPDGNESDSSRGGLVSSDEELIFDNFCVANCLMTVQDFIRMRNKARREREMELELQSRAPAETSVPQTSDGQIRGANLGFNTVTDTENQNYEPVTGSETGGKRRRPGPASKTGRKPARMSESGKPTSEVAEPAAELNQVANHNQQEQPFGEIISNETQQSIEGVSQEHGQAKSAPELPPAPIDVPTTSTAAQQQRLPPPSKNNTSVIKSLYKCPICYEKYKTVERTNLCIWNHDQQRCDVCHDLLVLENEQRKGSIKYEQYNYYNKTFMQHLFDQDHYITMPDKTYALECPICEELVQPVQAIQNHIQNAHIIPYERSSEGIATLSVDGGTHGSESQAHEPMIIPTPPTAMDPPPAQMLTDPYQRPRPASLRAMRRKSSVNYNERSPPTTRKSTVKDGNKEALAGASVVSSSAGSFRSPIETMQTSQQSADGTSPTELPTSSTIIPTPNSEGSGNNPEPESVQNNNAVTTSVSVVKIKLPKKHRPGPASKTLSKETSRRKSSVPASTNLHHKHAETGGVKSSGTVEGSSQQRNSTSSKSSTTSSSINSSPHPLNSFSRAIPSQSDKVSPITPPVPPTGNRRQLPPTFESTTTQLENRQQNECREGARSVRSNSSTSSRETHATNKSDFSQASTASSRPRKGPIVTAIHINQPTRTSSDINRTEQFGSANIPDKPPPVPSQTDRPSPFTGSSTSHLRNQSSVAGNGHTNSANRSKNTEFSETTSTRTQAAAVVTPVIPAPTAPPTAPTPTSNASGSGESSRSTSNDNRSEQQETSQQQRRRERKRNPKVKRFGKLVYASFIISDDSPSNDRDSDSIENNNNSNVEANQHAPQPDVLPNPIDANIGPRQDEDPICEPRGAVVAIAELESPPQVVEPPEPNNQPVIPSAQREVLSREEEEEHVPNQNDDDDEEEDPDRESPVELHGDPPERADPDVFQGDQNQNPQVEGRNSSAANTVPAGGSRFHPVAEDDGTTSYECDECGMSYGSLQSAEESHICF